MSDKLTTIEHLRSTAQKSKDLIAQVASTAADALEEMEGAKADRPEFLTLSIPATGWAATQEESISAAGYAFSYDAAVEGATAADSAETIISPSSMQTAVNCGLCPTSTVVDGAVRYYAVTAPTASLSVQVRIIKAKGVQA